MCLVRDLIDISVNELCRQKRSGGKNTFCLKRNCDIEHRSQQAAPVKLKDDDFVMLKSSDVTFLEPIGSTLNFSQELTREWKRQANALNEWTNLFMLSGLSEDVVTTNDINELEKFGDEASTHKTPDKTLKFERNIPSFETQYEWKSWEKDILAGKSSLHLSDHTFSESVEKKFKKLETALNDVIKPAKKHNEELSQSERMIEFERKMNSSWKSVKEMMLACMMILSLRRFGLLSLL